MSDSAVQAVRMLAGRYEVGQLIGRGGMADVHLGTDARLGRRVAIKLLKPELATDPAFRTRFRQEAQAAARMAHPTIVRVYDAGEETVADSAGYEMQVPFIVMEYVDGRLLKEIIAEEGPLEPREAVRIIDQVLTALEYSHRAGVVHRDIKPGNIMVVPNGQVKVMDFGIARAISDSAATVAQTSAILGTAQYFSPEQARGESVDARTDLYSAGIVLFELLTGRAPFRGATPVAVAYQHLSEAPVAPSTLDGRVSPALDAVVLRALAKDRFERYQSAAEFRTEVDAAASGQVPVRRTPSQPGVNTSLFGVAPGAAAATEATVRQLTVDEDERMRGTQTRPPAAWIWGGIATIVVVVAAVVFWVLTVQPPNIAVSTSIAVPSVTGQSLADGVAKFEDAGLQKSNIKSYPEASTTVPEGVITRTDPAGGGGDRVSPDQQVTIYYSSGAPKVDVPSVAGLSLADAQTAIQNAKLVFGSTTDQDSATAPQGTVLGIQPRDVQQTDGQLPEGTTVDVVVSTGNTTVPDVRGQDARSAGAALTAAGLTVRPLIDNSCSNGRLVSSMVPVPGSAPQGSTVTIRICSR